MKDRVSLFLRWWLLFAVIMIATTLTYRLGWFNVILTKDSSYLCAVTFVVFYVMSVWCGFKTWAVSQALADPNNFHGTGQLLPAKAKELERLVEVGWFASDLCLTLGMAGTIIGFIMMLAGFETFDYADPSSTQKLLGDLGKSMATALYTTIVGLTCGQLLKFQYFNLSQELNQEEV